MTKQTTKESVYERCNCKIKQLENRALELKRRLENNTFFMENLSNVDSITLGYAGGASQTVENISPQEFDRLCNINARYGITERDVRLALINHSLSTSAYERLLKSSDPLVQEIDAFCKDTGIPYYLMGDNTTTNILHNIILRRINEETYRDYLEGRSPIGVIKGRSVYLGIVRKMAE
ncbi:MAG: hypothetical protein RL557_687 [archaeon]|jgi:hypothetical protein